MYFNHHYGSMDSLASSLPNGDVDWEQKSRRLDVVWVDQLLVVVC